MDGEWRAVWKGTITGFECRSELIDLISGRLQAFDDRM